MATTWDPSQYAKFAGERNRPFFELVGRVDAPAPTTVLDLGCGNGPLTLTLADRWPDARIIGVDSSAAMLGVARELDSTGRVEWVEADLATWDVAFVGAPPDVIVSNATLQWVPQHLALLAQWSAALAPGGTLAVQVPGNFEAPSHRLVREVARGHSRAGELEAAATRLGSAEPRTYLQLLARCGLEVDVWETTYFHVLDAAGEQENPVLEWISGTGLRPVLDLLSDPAEREAFLTPYAAALHDAYPRTPSGVILPFRRIFAVGRKASSAA